MLEAKPILADEVSDLQVARLAFEFGLRDDEVCSRRRKRFEMKKRIGKIGNEQSPENCGRTIVA